jgi:hypothetical protein
MSCLLVTTLLLEVLTVWNHRLYSAQPVSLEITKDYPDEAKFFNQTGAEVETHFYVKVWEEDNSEYGELWVSTDSRPARWEEMRQVPGEH